MTSGVLGHTQVGTRERLSTVAAVSWVCVAVVLVRLVSVWQPLRSDEGGYLYAARHWQAGGEFLYGDYHVDRPPLLMAIFRLAALSDWDRAVRVLAIPFAVAAVVATARAAFVLAGDRGARWAAVVCAAFMTSPALAADQADGELFAVPFVAGSVALTVEAWRRRDPRAQLWLACGAGTLAASASLVKQNFLEGLVFAGAVVLAETARRHQVTARCARVTAAVVVGAVLPNLLTFAWARSTGLDGLQMWGDLAAFRADAFAVIWGGSVRAPVTRGLTLLALAVVSAMVPLAWTWVRECRSRARALTPVAWAVSASLLYGLAALVAGGSYWPHYLLQPAVLLSVAAGVVAAGDSSVAVRMRRWGAVAAVSAVTCAALVALVYALVPWVWFQERTGEWLAASSEPADSVFVAYGGPSVLETADLDTPYPYLWSLPMRTLDPDLARLRSTLKGPRAPTWVVEVNGLNSWQIDSDGRLRALVEDRYDVAATVCGNEVWLRSDLSRSMAPSPRC